jgi:RecB family exonuclease
MTEKGTLFGRFGSVSFVPLKRIAPSRYGNFIECPLREVFRSSGAPQLLAPPAAAHLGTVVHRLLEAAAGGAMLSSDEAETTFDQLIVDEEERLSTSAAGRGAVPLSRSVPDFEVRKRRAVHAAVAASGRRRPQAGSGSSEGGAVGTEMWVESIDGTIGGYIDEVQRRDSFIVLRDFKSGAAARKGSDAYAKALLQLQIYAALYAETFGTWPKSIEIVPVDSAAHVEEVDPDVCCRLLDSARALFRSTNGVVEQESSSATSVRLAKPAPAACRQCEFRPLCPAYLAARHEDGDWPRDVIGVVVRRDLLRNGTILFGVDEPAGLAHIRGVTNSEARHPSLGNAVSGCNVGFFNLSGNRETKSFLEGPSTTILTPVS